MGRTEAASRRLLLPGWLRLSVCCWACLNLLALSAPLAAAEPYEPPEIEGVSAPALPEFAQCSEAVEEPVGPPSEEAPEDPTAHQITLLRGELQQECRAQAQRLDEVIERQWYQLAEQLRTWHFLHDDLGDLVSRIFDKLERFNELASNPAEGGLIVSPMNNRGETWQVGGTVEVSNQPEGGEGDGGLQLAAIHEATETINQNDWSFLGIAIGSVALFMIWRLVRP
jgi:hypothetical protein